MVRANLRRISKETENQGKKENAGSKTAVAPDMVLPRILYPRETEGVKYIVCQSGATRHEIQD